jgi:amino acid transporter
MQFDHPYIIAFGVLALFWILYRLLSGTWNPLTVVRGEDGRYSTSKLQFWLWTIVALFSYVAFYAARVNSGLFKPIDSVPQSLLIAMGLSAVTTVAAKGITVAQVQNGSVAKSAVALSQARAAQVLEDDAGNLDLSKIQMLAWTLVAIGVYIINTCSLINLRTLDALPDISSALMTLMGIGQAAYLGKKLVTTDAQPVTPSPLPGGGDVPVVGDTQVKARGSLVERKPANGEVGAQAPAEAVAGVGTGS